MNLSDNREVAVRDTVRDAYGQIARGQGPFAGVAGVAGGCCGGGCVTEKIGYAAADLEAIPNTADMGLSCGNPTVLASLQPGETVVDLGSGGGLDCFLAGPKVGPRGRVIGVDMTADMISRARSGLADFHQRTGLTNVEFRLGEIEHLPVADNVADVVISNCVLNLSTDKPQVWREIARVLRPGGRVAVSDLALLRPLPDAVRGMVEALVGCVAGAVLIEEMERLMTAAGLVDIRLTPRQEYVAVLGEMQDPLYRRIIEQLPPGTTAADFITSLDVAARKPAARP